jgi:hypothetical protein
MWGSNGSTGDMGAVTWRDGTTGTSGVVSLGNSLTGSVVDDYVGGGGVTALTNGNYVVVSPSWNSGDATVDVGAVTWGDGTSGTSGFVSLANSLTGSTANDQVGFGGVTALTNGDYVVDSPNWDSADPTVDVGAVTWGDGGEDGHRLIGSISSGNSITGTSTSRTSDPWDDPEPPPLAFGFDYVNHQLVVGRRYDYIVTWATIPVRPAAPSIVSITPGNHSLSVAFTLSDNGGVSIDYYEYSTDDGMTWQRTTPDGTSSPFVISGLTNDTTYNVKIRAHNIVGMGDASNEVSATTLDSAIPTESTTIPTDSTTVPVVIPATGTNTSSVIPLALVILLAGALLMIVCTRNQLSQLLNRRRS